MTLPRPGLILVISAPSGGGKTSLCQRLLNWSANLMYSISCTTRAPRPGEENGRDYFFLSVEEFEAMTRRPVRSPRPVIAINRERSIGPAMTT